MKFLITGAEEVERHTEPRFKDINEGMVMPAKHEEMTIKISLTSSGDTREFTTEEILGIIMERLNTINAT